MLLGGALDVGDFGAGWKAEPLGVQGEQLEMIVMWSVSLRRARTTVNPLRPERASALVTTGVYRITRNPMYVGMALMLLAWAVLLASPAALAGPVTFIAYMNRFQIGPEEDALDTLFGPDYAAYRSRVRRWL